MNFVPVAKNSVVSAPIKNNSNPRIPNDTAAIYCDHGVVVMPHVEAKLTIPFAR
jgi:hypothetical protein